MAAWLLLALVAGSIVYCVLVMVAARQYRAIRPPALHTTEPVSVLKPLAGWDEGLEDNLRSIFRQSYPTFELIFAVHRSDDPAVPLVERLRSEYANIPSRLIVTGEPPFPNAKVWSLQLMTSAAAHDLLIMSDSDVRVTFDFLSVIAAEFQDPAVGVSTCPYRAVAGRSIWSRLEAVGMNTEFIGGVLVARMLEGMKFALGPTIAARKRVIQQVGGFEGLSAFLAEDFVLGNRAAAEGWRVLLSSYVIEHRIGSQPMMANFRHRLRWHRSSRRSRPAGYVGQLFTNPLPLAMMLLASRPDWWFAAALTVLVRGVTGYATCHLLGVRFSWLVIPQDLLSFGFWVAGFFGNTVRWRGRTYYLRPDGTFELVTRS
jgi:ceramide glucosyltransferase